MPPEDATPTLVKLHTSYLLSELQQQKSKHAALEGAVRRTQAELATLRAEIKRLKNKDTRVAERLEGNRKLFKKRRHF